VKQNVTGGTRHQGDATQLRTEREAFSDEMIPQTSRCELPVSMSRLESFLQHRGSLVPPADAAVPNPASGRCRRAAGRCRRAAVPGSRRAAPPPLLPPAAAGAAPSAAAPPAARGVGCRRAASAGIPPRRAAAAAGGSGGGDGAGRRRDAVRRVQGGGAGATRAGRPAAGERPMPQPDPGTAARQHGINIAVDDCKTQGIEREKFRQITITATTDGGDRGQEDAA
jgi:hypothetical protein